MSTFLIFVCFEAPNSSEGPEQLPFITSAVEIERSSLNDAVDLAMLTWATVTRNDRSGFPRPARSVFEATNPRHLQRLMAMQQMQAETPAASAGTDSDRKILVAPYEDALKRWEEIEITAALLTYEHWRQSDDAARSEPENRECFFLRQCECLAGKMNGEPEPPEPTTSLDREPLQVVLRRYPRPKSPKEWEQLLKAKQAAKVVGLGMDSLRQYRYEGEKSPDRLSGRDQGGRIWHKQEKGDRTIFYVPETLARPSDDAER